MKDMQTQEFPNVVDIVVVAVTCLIVLILAFPLYADASCAKMDVSRVDVSNEETPKAKTPEKQVEVVKPVKRTVSNPVTKEPVSKTASVSKAAAVPKAAPVSKVSTVSEAKPEKAKAEQITVDIETLKTRLKETDAIGVFTKLAIRSDIVDLVDEINRHRKQSKLELKMAEMRAHFDGLLLKIVALLEGDPVLSRDLYVSRESIWKSLLEVKA